MEDAVLLQDLNATSLSAEDKWRAVDEGTGYDGRTGSMGGAFY